MTVIAQVYRQTLLEHIAGGGTNEQRPAEADAREALTVRAPADQVVDYSTMRRTERRPVVVDARMDYRDARPGETPTGHIDTWEAETKPRASVDAEADVVRAVLVDDTDPSVVAKVPDMVTAQGGQVVVEHDLPGELADGLVVTALAGTQPVPYRLIVDVAPGRLDCHLYADTTHVTIGRPR